MQLPGKDLQEAQSKAYDLVESVSFDGAFYRKDIGNKGRMNLLDNL